jgi:antitoxin (DNA-binding transcriptional repressor) of toxin-antitoxin stability system
MLTIDVKDLEAHPTEVVRQVKGGETVQLVEDGRAVATITPVTPVQRPRSEEQVKAFLAELERLAQEIGKHWPEGVSAVDAVRDVRR